MRSWGPHDFSAEKLCDTDGALWLMEPAAMTTEYLEAELVAHAAWETKGLARMLMVLAEFDNRRGWALWQCQSAQQWLSWKCGVGYGSRIEMRAVRSWFGQPSTINPVAIPLA